ncbi:TetR family transcriptional regulator [Devosia sp.]|uniref:TetR family transcriptional regulator n=1 Tax=Devosia sp. TaxID=1871048 RepID=UPI003264D648
MAKASRQQASEHHQGILDAASHLFRKQGVAATSVPEIMRAAGLTHGGFYGHFASKEALAAQATAHAFDWLDDLFTTITTRSAGNNAAARRDLLQTYLSATHRDDPANGCVVAALANDIGRNPADTGTANAFVKGLEAAIARMAGDTGISTDRAGALVDYATVVGAITLARATAGTPLSEEILSTVKTALLTKA